MQSILGIPPCHRFMGHTFALDIRPKAGANGGATTGTWLRGAATEAFDSRGAVGFR